MTLTAVTPAGVTRERSTSEPLLDVKGLSVTFATEAGAVTAVRETPEAFKVSLVGCEALLVLVLWRWLALRGLDPAWTLAYAWHPLATLESDSSLLSTCSNIQANVTLGAKKREAVLLAAPYS